MSRRVGLFLPSLRGGGAERVVLTLAEALVDRGIATDLVLAQAEGPFLDRVPHRVRTIDLGVPRVAAAVPGLMRYLAEGPPDAMLSTVGNANVALLLARRLSREEVRVVIREGMTVSQAAAHPRAVRDRLIPVLMQRLYPWADGIVAVSAGAADDLARTLSIPRSEIRVIPNPVALPALAEAATQEPQHPWLTDGGPPVILGAGRLTEQKGFPVLLEAFASLLKRRPARLVILGEGEDRSRLEARVESLGVSEHVDLPGFSDNPYAAMARAAVFALPSLWEGLPNVIIEALALGLPVVASDCHSGPREILADGRWGRLVPVGDARALRDALEATLADPGDPAMRREAVHRFSPLEVVPRYLDALGVEPGEAVLPPASQRVPTRVRVRAPASPPPERARRKASVFLPSLRGGGAERAMVRLAMGLTDAGVETELVLAQVEGPYLEQLPKDLPVVDLKARRVLTALPGLVRYLRARNPDALIAAMAHTNVIAVWAHRLARVPTKLALVVQNTLSRSLAGGPRRARLVPWLIRRFYPWADSVVAVSEGVADDMAEHLGFPRAGIDVVFNPMVSEDLPERAREAVTHRWLADEETIPVILGVGRLNRQKNFWLLLEAFSILRAQRPVRLLILGEGEERASLEAKVAELGIGDDTDLPGFADNPFSHMARADVFALSSDWEGLPGVLIEALATGCPIVATDCPSGPFEILDRGRFGKLVPMDDPEALAKALAETLDDPPDRERLRARARLFERDKVVGEYRALLGLG